MAAAPTGPLAPDSESIPLHPPQQLTPRYGPSLLNVCVPPTPTPDTYSLAHSSTPGRDRGLCPLSQSWEGLTSAPIIPSRQVHPLLHR